MNLEEKMKQYKEVRQIKPQEEKIQETIHRSKNAFLMAEQKRTLSYHEFLWTQLKVIRKRWWLLQFLILAILWVALSVFQNEIYMKRSMGVAASLFAILIIPELWKNRSYGCMEIETASYFSLKQVYAARILLFGIADISFVTLFLGTALTGLHFELSDLIIQFLFPLCVTACICFGILCSKYSFNETVAIILCIIWSTVWLLIVLNETIYTMITIPIWCTLLSIAVFFLAWFVYRILRNCNQYLEVSNHEIRT